MKNTYKQFNNIEFDINEINSINADIDEFTKNKIKKNITNKVKKDIKKKVFKRIGISVAGFLLAFSLACTNDSFVAFARNLPILSSVFETFDGHDRNADYSSYTSFVEQTQLSNGYKVTINEAILDESQLSLVYTINSSDTLPPEEELTDLSFLFFNRDDNPTKINGESWLGMGFEDFKYIDNNTIRFFAKWDITSLNLPKENKIEINITNILDNAGNWDFEFHLSKEKTSQNTKVVLPNNILSVVDRNSVTHNLSFDKIILSPINTTVSISYEQPNSDDLNLLNLKFKDDKGKLINFTGGGTNQHPKDSSKMLAIFYLETLDKNTSKIYAEYVDNTSDVEYKTEINLN